MDRSYSVFYALVRNLPLRHKGKPLKDFMTERNMYHTHFVLFVFMSIFQKLAVSAVERSVGNH